MTRLTEIKSEWDHIAVLNEGWTGNATFKRAGKVVSLNARLVAGETPPLVVGSIPNEFRPYSPPGQTMNGLAVNINQADGKPRRYNYYRGQITIVGAEPGGTYEIRDTYLTTSPPPLLSKLFGLVWGQKCA